MRKKMLILLYYTIQALYIEFHIVAISKSDYDARVGYFSFVYILVSVSEIEIAAAARYILELPTYMTVIL